MKIRGFSRSTRQRRGVSCNARTNASSCSRTAVFDLIHAGHVGYLEWARQQGDALIVALNSDDSTRRLKGAARPFVPFDDRAHVIVGTALCRRSRRLRRADARDDSGPFAARCSRQERAVPGRRSTRTNRDRAIRRTHRSRAARRWEEHDRSRGADHRSPRPVAVKIAFTVNGPGEYAGWLRPLLWALYARDPSLQASVFFVPDDFATGREPAVARCRLPAAASLSAVRVHPVCARRKGARDAGAGRSRAVSGRRSHARRAHRQAAASRDDLV